MDIPDHHAAGPVRPHRPSSQAQAHFWHPTRSDVGDPEAWIADHTGQLDRALAETISLVSSDVLLDRLLAALSDEPLAQRLLERVAVYRVSVDATGVAMQVATREPTADQERLAGLLEIGTLLNKARETDPSATMDDLDLTPERRAQLNEDFAAYRRPDIAVPDGFDRALRHLDDLGLLSPVLGEDGTEEFVVHRWTAAALARMTAEEELSDAHRSAVAYWQRRQTVRSVAYPYETINQLLEAAYHAGEAGDRAEAARYVTVAGQDLVGRGMKDWAERICLECLARLAKDDPAAVMLLAVLGDVAKRRGSYEAAEEMYREALRVARAADARAHLDLIHGKLGQLAQLRGDLSGAERELLAALDLETELGLEGRSAFTYSSLGILAMDRDERDRAEELFQRAASIDRKFHNYDHLAIVLANLGVLADRRGDQAGAEESYLRADALHEREGDRPALIYTRGNLGILAQGRGDYQRAEELFMDALAIAEEIDDPVGIAQVYEKLAALAFERRDLSLAERRLRRALLIRRDIANTAVLAGTLVDLGIVTRAGGDDRTAEACFSEALDAFHGAESSDDLAGTTDSIVRALVERGDIRLTTTRPEEAFADFTHAAELSPENRAIRGRRGEALRELRRYDEALAEFDRLVASDPEDPLMRTARAVTYQRAGRHDEALSEFSRAIDLNPQNTELVAWRAETFLELERYDEALADFARIIDLTAGFTKVAKAVRSGRAGG